MIALTIIIPTVGRRRLARVLRTIESQETFADDVEVIVVGDGPRPQARAIFERAAAKHANWVYFEYGPKPGWGCWQRMEALKQARGRYVMFINDDDVYRPGALRAIRSAISGCSPSVERRWPSACVMASTCNRLTPGLSLALSNSMCSVVPKAMGAQDASRSDTPAGTGIVSRAGRLIASGSSTGAAPSCARAT